VINKIVGGFACRGCSSSNRKKHLREIQSVNSTSAISWPRRPTIVFINDDFKEVDPTHDDPMVIVVEVDNFTIMKTLVDQGISIDILYWTFKKMRIPETKIQPYDDQIISFSREQVDTRGYIDLYTTFGEDKNLNWTIKIRYLIVEANTSYNILLGRPYLNVLWSFVSTPHLAMKFSFASSDIVMIHVDQKVARESYVTSLRVEPTNKE